MEKARLNGVPTLLVRPSEQKPANIGLLWIHGGGFITGMKEMVYMSRTADLVKRYGITVVAPGYRLAWMEGYAIGRPNGWLNANDIRELENRNPIPDDKGGNACLVNGNMFSKWGCSSCCRGCCLRTCKTMKMHRFGGFYSTLAGFHTR